MVWLTGAGQKGLIKGRVTDKQVQEFLEKQKKSAAKKAATAT
jgi:hypothetical protein